jgi:hypothetical protein
MSLRITSGAIDPKDCSIESSTYTLKAQLHWSGVKDLDIWARSRDCHDESRSLAYHRFEKSHDFRSSWFKIWRHATSKSAFHSYTEEKELWNAKACSVRYCRWNRDTGATRMDKCRLFENQYPKWVWWHTRMVQGLDSASFAKKKGWQSSTDPLKSKMFLDIDDTNYGAGPETVTFTNVPAGRYEIAVHAFYDTRSMKDRVFKKADPTVFITLPGGQHGNVQVKCKVKRECEVRVSGESSYQRLEYAKQMKLWRVADIVIEGTQNGKKTIRIVPNGLLKTSATIGQDSIPTISHRMRGYETTGFMYDTRVGVFQVHKAGDLRNMNDKYLQHACQTECKVDEDQSRFASCVAKGTEV